MIPESFLFISRPINDLSYPISVMEKALLKADLMSLNLAVEPPVMRNSSTYNTIMGKQPPVFYM